MDRRLAYSSMKGEARGFVNDSILMILRQPPTGIERQAEDMHRLFEKKRFKAHLRCDDVDSVKSSHKGKRRPIIGNKVNAVGYFC